MAHSSNVIVRGGTFVSAQGDFHIHYRDSESGLHTLRLGVSLGAIHDSAERYPPPNCHPDTRKAVRQIILDWIHNESSASSFFWLYGLAGAGKTAILQAIAEFLCSPSEFDENFGGSFFFSRGKTGRDRGHFLFSTIAYQLALKVPGLRQHVNHIMELDPTLHTKSMDVQIQNLIVNAFKFLSPLPQHSYLVIIDGLDECHDKATQQSILRLLREMITVHKLPLRFLIGSRPESHIRDSFDQVSFYTITRRVALDENFDPGRDIRVFLQDGFAKICDNNSVLSRVEQPWPEEGIIDLLVQRSSGQFIYAATVLKFVGADFFSPTNQLALVLKPDPTAFSDLDQLYTQILSVYPSAVDITHILGIIGASRGHLAEVMEDIFGMEEGQLKLVLRGLSSLMRDENKGVIPNVIPNFAHASFRDYLSDSSRSGPFHVNLQEYETQVTKRSFALIVRLIRSRRTSSITPGRVLHTSTWNYFTRRLPNHFFCSPKVVKEAIMTDINDLVQEFWGTSSDGAVGMSFIEMHCLFGILQGCFYNFDMWATPNSYKWLSSPSDVGDQIIAKFKILFDEYRKVFDQSLSKSKDLGDMLRVLPGVVVQKHSMTMRGMAKLYRVNPDLLERLIKSTIDPLGQLNFRYKLDTYLSGFLQDRDRSQLYYCDPILQHISICRHFLSLLDRSNAFNLLDGSDLFQVDFEPHELHDYAHSHFYDHLCAATTGFLYARNISDDHPAVVFLHDLETTAYYIDEDYTLGRRIIQAILRWENMLNFHLNGVTVSVANADLMERVCQLTNKIYQEMLCITRHERLTYITMGGLRPGDHVSAFSLTPRYMIVLSWDLLAWMSVEGKILRSFTNFITTPELSGPLYIDPDIYQTQVTEYSLETIFLKNNSHPSHFNIYNSLFLPDWSFMEHISHALPSEMIFYLLRLIHSQCLIPDYSTKLLPDMLEIVIKWLQGLGSERPNDLYDRFQGELLRHKELYLDQA